MAVVSTRKEQLHGDSSTISRRVWVSPSAFSTAVELGPSFHNTRNMLMKVVGLCQRWRLMRGPASSGGRVRTLRQEEQMGVCGLRRSSMIHLMSSPPGLSYLFLSMPGLPEHDQEESAWKHAGEPPVRGMPVDKEWGPPAVKGGDLGGDHQWLREYVENTSTSLGQYSLGKKPFWLFSGLWTTLELLSKTFQDRLTDRCTRTICHLWWYFCWEKQSLWLLVIKGGSLSDTSLTSSWFCWVRTCWEWRVSGKNGSREGLWSTEEKAAGAKVGTNATLSWWSQGMGHFWLWTHWSPSNPLLLVKWVHREDFRVQRSCLTCPLICEW